MHTIIAVHTCNLLIQLDIITRHSHHLNNILFAYTCTFESIVTTICIIWYSRGVWECDTRICCCQVVWLKTIVIRIPYNHKYWSLISYHSHQTPCPNSTEQSVRYRKSKFHMINMSLIPYFSIYIYEDQLIFQFFSKRF